VDVKKMTSLSSKSGIKCSIIIVNWNVKELLRECLNSIFSHLTKPSYEVIVIDNASEDDSVEMIRTQFQQVKIIVNHVNYGFAKACNQGIKIAQGEYFFILNPDTIITSNTLKSIIDFMDFNSTVGVGGCYIYYPNGKPQPSFYKFPSLANSFGRMFSLFRFLPRTVLTNYFFDDYPINRIPETVDRVLGGAMVLRKKALDEVGLFDEAYFMYAEEVDLCYRIEKKGWAVAPIPNTKVYHFHEQSSLQDVKTTTFHKLKSDFIFFNKFYPFYQVVLLRFIQFLGTSFRSIFWLVLYLFSSKNRQLSKNKFLGYIKVLLFNFSYSKSLI
jgi:hypothetical protein